MSRHMSQERELLAKRQMLRQDVHNKFDELDALFQQVITSDAWKKSHQKYNEIDALVKEIVETNTKIEEQREKQEREQ